MVAANDPTEATPGKARAAAGIPATHQEAAPAVKEETKPKSPRNGSRLTNRITLKLPLRKRLPFLP